MTPLDKMSSSETPGSTQPFEVAALYIAFAMTGIGVALPGVLLPVMLQRWHLQDAQAGRLFFLAWIGSSVGALLVRGSLRTVLLLGTLSIAIGSTALALCAGHGASVYISLYGFGLGLTMTAISLIRQHQAHDSAKEMVRLNLLWSIGAFACPSLSIVALRNDDTRSIFLAVAISFGLIALFTLFNTQIEGQVASATANRPWLVFQTTPLPLIVMAFLITGTEASVGGWLATYAHRDVHSLAQTVAAPTCFWMGILLSRLVWSVRKPVAHGSYIRVVRVSAALMVTASIVLIASSQSYLILLASTCLGFGIGPTYPLILAGALRFQRGGAIFFIAGAGSAVLPWMTGLVSTSRGSLRTGLAVPAAAAALMLLFSLRLQLSMWRSQQAESAHDLPTHK